MSVCFRAFTWGAARLALAKAQVTDPDAGNLYLCRRMQADERILCVDFDLVDEDTERNPEFDAETRAAIDISCRRRRSALAIIHQPMKVATETTRMIRVASALILGLTPRRTLEKTTIGKVVAFGPETKLVMTKSSTDSVNPSSQPAAMAGAIDGRVIRKNTLKGVAPRSSAASSTD